MLINGALKQGRTGKEFGHHQGANACVCACVLPTVVGGSLALSPCLWTRADV
jgi:hypothetical protein